MSYEGGYLTTGRLVIAILTVTGEGGEDGSSRAGEQTRKVGVAGGTCGLMGRPSP